MARYLRQWPRPVNFSQVQRFHCLVHVLSFRAVIFQCIIHLSIFATPVASMRSGVKVFKVRLKTQVGNISSRSGSYHTSVYRWFQICSSKLCGVF